MICNPHHMLFGWSNQEEWDRWSGVRCIQDFGGKAWGKKLLGRPRRRWEDNIEMIFKKWEGAWAGLICIWTWAGGGLLWMRQWTYGFHKMREISWLAKNLLASQDKLYSVELVG